MRALLVLLLINGLVPSLGEVAEAAVHYAVEGHLAHSDSDHGDLGDLGQEHGCGATEHHCTCCASQAVLAPPKGALSRPVSAASQPWLAAARLVSLHNPAPPYRPPIAS
jgi:hypothetical protein